MNTRPNPTDKTPLFSTASLYEQFDKNPEKKPSKKNPHSEKNIDETRLENIITPSVLKNKNSATQATNILNAFNQGIIESCFTTSVVRGEWIDRDEFLVGHRNRKTELAAFNPDYNTARTLNASPNVVTEILGKFKQDAPFFGDHGSYVLNVPVGKYALAHTANNKPIIFAPGPHVIHDANFRFDPKRGFVNQSQLYIQHETYHILQIPAGKIAKIWIGSEPLLLEARPEPYVFNHPRFRLEPHTQLANDYFFDATEPLIVHGSIKRLIPKSTQAAITYDNGILEVIPPHSDRSPIIINSAVHEVLPKFISTGIENINFPSQVTKERRLKENPRATTDELSYELYKTSDSMEVGVQLYVAFRIKNPQLALSILMNEEGILHHIESCASSDMRMAIQSCTSQDFLKSSQTKPPTLESTLSKMPVISSVQKEVPTIQDTVREKLSKDLLEYGIELIRLTFESTKMLNKEIEKEISKQSLRTAEASSKEAVIEQNYRIAKREAEQNATIKATAQQQVNDALISKSDAELEAARKSAEATVIRAEAEKRAAVLKAEGKKEAANLKGEAYANNKELVELKKAKMLAKALGTAQFVPPQMMPFLTQFSWMNDNGKPKPVYPGSSTPEEKEKPEQRRVTAKM